MGEVVADLLSQVKSVRPALQSGGTLLSNDPFHGTHLPDITAITPVFAGERSRWRLWRAGVITWMWWHDPRFDASLQPNHC